MCRIASLKLEIEEYRRDSVTPQVRYTRHIAVERAPALFHLGCTDPECSDGGHDVTGMIMGELRSMVHAGSAREFPQAARRLRTGGP